MLLIKQLGIALLLLITLLLGGIQAVVDAAPKVEQPAQDLPPVTIYDISFQEFLWSATAELTNGATFTATRVVTGGNEGAFRLMSHRLPPVAGEELATVVVDHIYAPVRYTPFFEGEIRAIDYAEDGIILSFPFPEAFSTTQALLQQDGRLFRSVEFIRFVAQNSSHAWESKALLDLTATDFVAVDGSGDHPDFTIQGGPIRFGYTRTNSRSATLPPIPADQVLVIDQGVDNWQVTVHRDNTNQPPQAHDDTFILDSKNGLPSFQFFDVVVNDSDVNHDQLTITEVTEPSYGSAGILSEGSHTIVFNPGVGSFVDDFEYTISDGSMTSSARVEVYLDCACTLECISIGAAHAFVPGQPEIDLPLIYRVRDQILKPTEDGQRYVTMYYRSNPEILVKIMAHEALRAEAIATVVEWQPSLHSLVDGDGSAHITQAQIDALDAFLANLSAVASPELQQIIASERERLGPLDAYVGMSVKEAKAAAIGDATFHLPLIRAQ